MSFVAKPTITITLTFRDDDGKESTTEILLPGATTAANAITFGTAVRALVAAVSDATLIGMNILLGYYENAIGTIASSDVENKGVLLFNSANGLKTSLAVPSMHSRTSRSPTSKRNPWRRRYGSESGRGFVEIRTSWPWTPSHCWISSNGVRGWNGK